MDLKRQGGPLNGQKDRCLGPTQSSTKLCFSAGQGALPSGKKGRIMPQEQKKQLVAAENKYSIYKKSQRCLQLKRKDFLYSLHRLFSVRQLSEALKAWSLSKAKSFSAESVGRRSPSRKSPKGEA